MTGAFFQKKYYSQLSGKKSFNSPNLTIRIAQQEDLKDLVDIISGSFYSYTGIASYLNSLLRLGVYEDFRHRLRAPLSSSFVCLVGSISSVAHSSHYTSIVGTVEVSFSSTNPLQVRSSLYPYISNLAVHPNYRRQGIAQQLLMACEEIVQERGYQELYLHVLEDNQQAKQLYYKLGYRLKQTELPWHWCFWKASRRLLLHKSLISNQAET